MTDACNYNYQDSRYLFSQFREGEFNQLYQVLSQIFNCSKSDIENIYQKMRQEFEKESNSLCTLDRNVFLSDDIDFQRRYNDAFAIGIDIPSILELAKSYSNKQTIIILGQDPKRNDDKRVEEIEVATPYALHSKYCREISHTKHYFNLIKVLLDKGYRIYLTDIYKIWIGKSEQDSDNGIKVLPKNDRYRFMSILQQELEIFEPITVITWGRKAENVVNRLNRKNLNINHISFPHPSGQPQARIAWSQLMGQDATEQNKLEYFRTTILEYLEQLTDSEGDT